MAHARNVTTSQVSESFIQGMRDRMAVSYFKYGDVAQVKDTHDALRSMEKRLKLYQETGNTEWLMDAANFLMIEFMFPHHPKAHFRPTDSQESPGRYFKGEADPTNDPNL